MKPVPFLVDGSGMYQHAVCDESLATPGPVKGQAAANGCRAG